MLDAIISYYRMFFEFIIKTYSFHGGVTKEFYELISEDVIIIGDLWRE
jgi:hypothetical protein